MHSNKSLGGLRRLLVIFQFTLSIALIICTIVVYNQIQFILTKDLGLRKDNIVFHDLNRVNGHKEAYRNDIKQLSGVQNITYTNSTPLGIGNTTYSVDWPGKQEDDETYFHVIQTDHNFVKTFNIQLLEGSDLPEKVDTTMAAYLVNEEAVKVMGLEDAVGQEISVWGRKGKVYGVVKNFNHQSLFQKIDPVIIFLNPQGTWQAFIAISSNDIPGTMAHIKEAYEKYDQEYPFDYQFIDQNYANNYKSVVTAGTLSTIFAIIAIVVSCLGLFGLALYMTEQRKKETGVRKVFGASVYQLSLLFSLDFLKLVLVAFIISIPLAWYVSDAWLSDFSFRIEVTYLPFVIGGVCALVIALLTVNYHIMRAAMANPVKALRYE